MRASDQILEHLAPKREDRYHRTALDNVRLGDASTEQLQHYLACRRQLEEHLDEESVFDELCRLAMHSDEETSDWFDRITAPARKKVPILGHLLPDAVCGVERDRLLRIAGGMFSDGWAEHEIAYALGTLRAAA